MPSEELHRTLLAYNHRRLRPALPETRNPERFERELELQAQHLRLEREFVEKQRECVRCQAARAPRRGDEFVDWFQHLRETGAGQNDPLFSWLATEASSEEMRWFLAQEVAGEAGFEDLVALTQLQFPTRVKLVLARNYWNEMGRGQEGGVNGPLLSHLADSLDLPEVPIVTESIALGNLMMALGCNRRYAYQSIGALGVIELTAPSRAALVNAGLKRLDVQPDVRRYFAVQATLDAELARVWSDEVLRPLVDEHPEVTSAIAEGALMRLNAGMRCYRRYRHVLWPDARGRALAAE